MKGKLIIPIAAVAITAAGVYGAKTISAMGPNGDRHDALVQKLAAAFGKSDSEVEAVFTDFRDEQQAEREAAYTTKLDDAVTAGELTSEQRDLILAKHDELQQQHQNENPQDSDLTPEQWREQRQSERDALETWASDNGIDRQYLMPEREPMGGGMGHGDRDGMGFGGGR